MEIILPILIFALMLFILIYSIIENVRLWRELHAMRAERNRWKDEAEHAAQLIRRFHGRR